MFRVAMILFCLIFAGCASHTETTREVKRDSRDYRDYQDYKNYRDYRDSRDSKISNDSRDYRDSSDYQDYQDYRDYKDYIDSRDSRQSSSQDTSQNTSQDIMKQSEFIGLEFGLMDMEFENKDIKGTGSGYKIGLRLFGSDSYFNDYIGLAYYPSVNFLLADGDFTSTAGILNTRGTFDYFYINFLGNIDLLVNFYKGQNGAFGAFIGAGAGIDYESAEVKATNGIVSASASSSKIGFYIDARFGLQTILAKHSKISLIYSLGNKQRGFSLAYDYRF